MILGGFDSLDGLLHGTDTLVVEFTTGILAPLDLGVEANNQLSSSLRGPENTAAAS